MPNILLIKAPSHSDVVAPPLGLGYLAGAVRDTAHVRILDGVKEGLTPKGLFRLARSAKPDIIGFSVVSAAQSSALALIRAARLALPGCVILAGGPHPTAMPKEFYSQAWPDLDYILRGEAETSLNMLVRDMGRRRACDASLEDIAHVPGVCAKVRDGDICNPICVNPTLESPDMPAWGLMPPRSYPRAPHGAFYKGFPVAPVLTSRGCSFACGFCSVPALSGRSIRFRPPALVAREIKTLASEFGVQEAQIIDDNFTASKAHALAVCQAIIAQKVRLPWTCPNGVRMENLDEELVQAMKDAGCYSVSLGLESGSPRILERMHKGLNLDNTASTVNRLVSKGLEVNGFFILGYPGETLGDMEQTIRFSKKLQLTRANFSLFTPLPGCPEWDRLQQEPGATLRPDSNFAQVGYVPQGMTARALKAKQRNAFIRFYARSGPAFSLLSSLRSVDDAYYLARRAFHWIAAPGG